MRPDEQVRVLAGQWLDRAGANLARARLPMVSGGFWEDYCFDAQQAAEKAIKAILIFRGVQFPYTHNIGVLVDLVTSHGIPWDSDLNECAKLTKYGVKSRYPGEPMRTTEADHRVAVEQAEKVVSWAEKLLAADSCG
jgi:HEPN domain-containing protein